MFKKDNIIFFVELKMKRICMKSCLGFIFLIYFLYFIRIDNFVLFLLDMVLIVMDMRLYDYDWRSRLNLGGIYLEFLE